MSWSVFGSVILPLLIVPFLVVSIDGGLSVRARLSRVRVQRLPDVEVEVRITRPDEPATIVTASLTADLAELVTYDGTRTEGASYQGPRTSTFALSYQIRWSTGAFPPLTASMFQLRLEDGKVIPARARGSDSGLLELYFEVPESFSGGTLRIGGMARSPRGVEIAVVTPVFCTLSSDVESVIDDFNVLVPIYGSITYLENVEYLRQYGDRVILCTTTSEKPEFDRALDDIATRHNFRVFRGDVPRPRGQDGSRATAGTVRDRLVRDGLTMVDKPYVVCIDADTTSPRSLNELVGAMVERDLDLASVRLVPTNRDTILAKLQAHEYRVAMRMLRVVPWLVSGACHAARTEVHRAVMSRHSLFFQGNDVELGALADAAGYRVGHVPFAVDTTVPPNLRAYFRQRLAWSGGIFRLFIVNIRLGRDHPVFWFYGAVVVTLLAPTRYWALLHPGRALLVSLLVYVALMVYLHSDRLDRWVPLLPIYHGITAMVVIPLGAIIYFRMAFADHNFGVIRPARNSAPNPEEIRSPVRLLGFKDQHEDDGLKPSPTSAANSPAGP